MHMDLVKKITHSDTIKDQTPRPFEQLHEVPLFSLVSVKGALRRYANQSLIQREKEAWVQGVQENHEYSKNGEHTILTYNKKLSQMLSELLNTLNNTP